MISNSPTRSSQSKEAISFSPGDSISKPGFPVTVKVDLRQLSPKKKQTASDLLTKQIQSKYSSPYRQTSSSPSRSKSGSCDSNQGSVSLATIVIPVHISRTAKPIECQINPKQNINSIMAGLIRSYSRLGNSNQKELKEFVLKSINQHTTNVNIKQKEASLEIKASKQAKAQEQAQYKQIIEFISETDILIIKSVFDILDVSGRGKIEYSCLQALKQNRPNQKLLSKLCLTLLHRKQSTSFEDMICFLITEPHWLQTIRQSKLISK